jgi:protocatechuate 3,4-dioxygenase beta subunit
MTSVFERFARTFNTAAAIAFVIFASVGLAMSQAQSAAADLRGTVVDPNGAAVPGATVTARNLSTNISRSTTSGSDGLYTFIALPPGDYEVIAEASTFSRTVIPRYD